MMCWFRMVVLEFLSLGTHQDVLLLHSQSEDQVFNQLTKLVKVESQLFLFNLQKHRCDQVNDVVGECCYVDVLRAYDAIFIIIDLVKDFSDSCHFDLIKNLVTLFCNMTRLSNILSICCC